MAYLGNSPVLSQQEYRNIDNISGSFNGVTTSFALRVNGVAPVPAPQSSNQCLISVNGVVQKPDDTGATGFRLSGGNIIFSSAPTGGQSFFGVILAGADYIYAGENFPDGTVTAPSITFKQDLGTGFYRNGAGEVRFTSSGTNAAILNSSSLTAPSFIPTSSTAPTNGVYLPAANTVGISTGGSGRVFVDSSGRVGIGTASPATDVHISGSGNRYFRLQSTTLGTATLGTQSSSYGLIASGDVFLSTTGAPLTFLSDGASGVIKFGTGAAASERLRIDSSGNVGVGTASPQGLLHVEGVTGTAPARIVGSSTNSSVLALYNNAATTNRFIVGQGYSSGTDNVAFVQNDANAALVFGTNTAERMRITAAGLVGIGTSSPATKIQIQHADATASVFRLSRDGDNATTFDIDYNTATGNVTLGPTQSSGAAFFNLGFKVAGSTRMQIDGSGRVGIGTTSPSRLLHLSAADSTAYSTSDFDQTYNFLRIVNTTGAKATGIYLGSGSTGEAAISAVETSAGSTSLTFGTRGGGSRAERMRLDESGRLLVGTSSSRGNNFNTTGQDMRLQVEGTDYLTSGASFTSNSNTATDGPSIVLNRSRGTTIGSNTVVQSGDRLGYIGFEGSDGSEFVQAATIICEVDATPGANNMPGRIVLSTTASGASSPTERMRIDRNGNVAVGGAGSSVVRLWVLASTTDSTAFAFACYNSSSQDLFYIRNDGLIFTGLRTNSPYNLTVSNAANCHIGADGVLYRSTSSIRFKTDVEDLEDQYADAVLSCRPVWFRSTASGDSAHPDWGYWGFIAEEVAEIDPRLVFWKTHETIQDEDGNKTIVELEEPQAEGVQYDRFVPHLVNLLNRQKEQIESQGAAIAALEARLSALESA